MRLHGAAGVVLGVFTAVVVAYVARHWRQLFLPRFGRSHRLAGGAYLAWLVVGVAELCFAGRRRGSAARACVYDVVLGALGTVATVTAARDFGRAREASATSGTLDEAALVTRSEMVDHAFYQGLNVVQVLGLHGRRRVAAPAARAAILAAQTAPWLARSRFPVNSFSANYDPARGGGDPRAAVNVLYRLKKYQYLFYKHALLHGLNVTNCVAPRPLAPERRPFRAYWLSLNAAYTMEFFLQTLVKRRVMRQGTMLLLNKVLMAGSSLAAVAVLAARVDWRVAAASWVLNLAHRGHDVANTLLVAAAAAALGVR